MLRACLIFPVFNCFLLFSSLWSHPISSAQANGLEPHGGVLVSQSEVVCVLIMGSPF